MAVEGIGHIFPVRNILYNAVFLAKLFNLQPAQALCRCSVNCIEMAVLFLEFIDLLVDVCQYLKGKLTVLNK